MQVSGKSSIGRSGIFPASIRAVLKRQYHHNQQDIAYFLGRCADIACNYAGASGRTLGTVFAELSLLR